MERVSTASNIDNRATAMATTAATTRDIFNEPITILTGVQPYYKSGDVSFNYKDAKRHTRPLGAFLGAMERGIYANDVQRARQIFSDALQAWKDGDRDKYNELLKRYKWQKALPPMAIIGGVCPTNTGGGFLSYTDVCSIDIDLEKPHKPANGNEWIAGVSLEQLKAAIGRLPWVSYCAISAGGRGLFALIPYESHTNHDGHYRALRAIFKKHLKITLDNTSDIVRKRYMSYDPHPYINRAAAIFTAVDDVQRATPSTPSTPTFGTSSASAATWDEKHVIACIKEIEARHIDITIDYHSWVQAAAALAATFGSDKGWQYFSIIAQQSPLYNERQNERLFGDVQKQYNGGRKCSLNTFFWLCKNGGVTYADKLVKSKKSTTLQPLPVAANYGDTRDEAVPSHPAPPATPSTTATPSTPPTIQNAQSMTMAEAAELQRMRAAIEGEAARLCKLRQASPPLDHLCSALDLEPAGITNGDDVIWMMTNDQFAAMYGSTAPF